MGGTEVSGLVAALPPGLGVYKHPAVVLDLGTNGPFPALLTSDIAGGSTIGSAKFFHYETLFARFLVPYLITVPLNHLFDHSTYPYTLMTAIVTQTGAVQRKKRRNELFSVPSATKLSFYGATNAF